MKVPSEYLDDLLKPDALKNKGARDELGRHLDALRGEVDRLQDASLMMSGWRNWVPVLYQNGAAVGCTITMARYRIRDGELRAMARLVTTAAGAVGAVEVRGLPYATKYSQAGGDAILFVGGVHRVALPVVGAGGFNMQFVIDNNAGAAGVTPAFALAIGNDIRLDITYEFQR